jgi:hypothetical protein
MELWGSSYLLQDVEAVRLIASLGSSTDQESPGLVKVSFTQEPGVFATARRQQQSEIVAKWDVALRLMALLHVLVLQNKLLRSETPEIRVPSGKVRVFTVSGGWRSSPIVCAWNAATVEVECRPVEGAADQFELVLKEEAAAELAMSLAERFARNGTMTALGEAGPT